MSIMLITYEDKKRNGAVDPVLEFIKAYKHIRLSESTFAIETHENTKTIFDEIMKVIGDNGHLLIVTLMKPFSENYARGDERVDLEASLRGRNN